MDILDIIKEEHRKVSALFEQAQKMEPEDDALHDLAQQIEQELTRHLDIEERLFYKELRARAEDSEELVDMFEAYTEHKAAKSLMELLRSGRKPDEQFKAELQVLGENVKHHVQEEESTVFTLARELMDEEEREERGEAWERAKRRATAPARKTPARRGAAKKSTSRKKTARAKKTTRTRR